MLRVVISYTPDGVYIDPYIARLLQRYHENIVAVIETRGRSILKRRSRFEQLEYLCALPFVVGIGKAIHYAFRMLMCRLRKGNPVTAFCEENAIPLKVVHTINSREAQDFLKSMDCDVLFNQSQHILQKGILAIPSIGTMNRHGALLPHYRGRLAPFWQIVNGEKYGGLTYHLLNEGIDTGPIIFQQRIPITDKDTVNTIIDKMYDLAVEQFGTALAVLERPDWQSQVLPNPEEQGSYYSSPGLKEALKYRLMLMGLVRRPQPQDCTSSDRAELQNDEGGQT